MLWQEESQIYFEIYKGPNYATDAACASTFAALMDACHLLQSRQVDLMIAGASDRTM